MRIMIISLLLSLLLAIPAAAQGGKGVGGMVVCQCGCGMVLENCNHAECAVRDTMTALIEQQSAQGKTKDEIIAFFVARYGEAVLAAPTKRGFNLTAWVLPFVGLAAGAGVVYLAVTAWVRRGRGAAGAALTPREGEDEDEQYRRRLEEELKEFPGGRP